MQQVVNMDYFFFDLPEHNISFSGKQVDIDIVPYQVKPKRSILLGDYNSSKFNLINTLIKENDKIAIVGDMGKQNEFTSLKLFQIHNEFQKTVILNDDEHNKKYLHVDLMNEVETALVLEYLKEISSQGYLIIIDEIGDFDFSSLYNSSIVETRKNLFYQYCLHLENIMFVAFSLNKLSLFLNNDFKSIDEFDTLYFLKTSELSFPQNVDLLPTKVNTNISFSYFSSLGEQLKVFKLNNMKLNGLKDL